MDTTDSISNVSSLLLNCSILDLPREQLQKEYDHLKALLITAQHELEEKKQQAYDCKRRIQVAVALEHEYQSEIQELREGKFKDREQLTAKLHKLENENLELVVSQKEQINSLENTLAARIEQFKELQSQVEHVSHNTAEDKDKYQQIEKEHKQLQSEIQTLQSMSSELQNQYDELEISTKNLDDNTRSLNDEIEDLKQSITSKTSELDDVNSELCILREDLAMRRIQLESISSKPLNKESKGNSLFAEVDDRRIKLQSNIQAMKTKCLEIRKECEDYLKQITILRAENISLCQKRDFQLNQDKEENETLLNYKERVQNLEALIDEYIVNVSKKESVGNKENNPEFGYIQNMLKKKWDEIEYHRKLLRTWAQNITSLADQVKAAHAEIRHFKLNAIQLEHQVGEYHSKVEDCNLNVISEQEVLDDGDGSTDDIPQTDHTYARKNNFETNINVSRQICSNNIDFSRLLQRKLATKSNNHADVNENSKTNELENSSIADNNKLSTSRADKKVKVLQPKQKVFVSSFRK